MNLDAIKPELDGINLIYSAAFEEGRRSAFRELLPVIQTLREHFAKVYPTPDFKNDEGRVLQNREGETNHGTQSSQTGNRQTVEAEVS